jgi:hypothetical protein
MRNRNQHRLLNDNQIKEITAQVTLDLIQYANESADTLVDHYLRGDAEGLFEVISNWIETAEDEVRRQLNTDLMEDSFKDDNYNPDYEF